MQVSIEDIPAETFLQMVAGIFCYETVINCCNFKVTWHDFPCFFRQVDNSLPSQQPQIYLHSDETNNASREFSYHPLRLAQSIRIITFFDWSKESKEIFDFHCVIRERIEPSVTMAKVDFLEF